MMKRWSAALLATALVFGVAACGDDDNDNDTGSSATTAGDGGGGDAEGALSIAADDYSFDVDSELDGGLVTLDFENTGEQRHEAAFVTTAGLDEEEWMDAFDKVLQGGPIPAGLESPGAAPEIEGGSSTSVSFNLPEGEYYLMCPIVDESAEDGSSEDGTPAEGEAAEGSEANQPHYRRGMLEKVTVTGGSPGEPEGDATITATDYTFAAEGLVAGKQTVVFRNESPTQLHHVVSFRYPADVTPEDALKATQTLMTLEEGQAPPEGTPQFEEDFFSPVISNGAIAFEADLQAGTYVLLCFIQDRTGGPPHAIAHQMMTPVAVA